jgi:hypothetical protein
LLRPRPRNYPQQVLERLRQSIITDIKQEMTDIKQVVREAVKESIAEECKASGKA